MARTGYCEDLDRGPRESLSAASPHSHAKALKASVDLLMRHLELTHRQAEVLHWVADGKTNDEISVILGCSFFTVKNHLRKIFQHLNVHSRTAAAACAYRAHIAEAAEYRLQPVASRAPQSRAVSP